jgi:tetratricopeptide (TPR) repeat protein
MRERALAITEKVFGREHPNVVDPLNSLASLLHIMGRLDDARPMYERAIAIVEHAHGREHPDLIHPLYNLAIVREVQGDARGALALYERSAALTEKIHGPDHPEVGMRLSAVADAHRVLEDYEEALPLAERAVGLLEKDEWAQSELAYARWVLARVLVALDRDRPRARELATQARERYRVDGDEATVAAAQSLLETLGDR